MKTGYWRGREWTIREATKLELETIAQGTYGVMFEDAGLILYHPEATEDMKIQAILHEAGHAMFPEWEAEPNKNSKSELGVFERDVKSFLEEFGVDLGPLLEGDNDDRIPEDSGSPGDCGCSGPCGPEP